MTGKFALKEALEKEFALYDRAPIGLGIISRDLRFLRVNDALADINGVQAEEHVGRHVSEVVPSLLDAASQLMQEVTSRRQKVGPFEIRGETPSMPGIERYWSETWSPIFDDQGHVYAAMVSALEITDRKSAEMEREKALRDTERLLRLQSALSTLMHAALRDQPTAEVLESAASTVSAALCVPLCSVTMLNDTEGSVIVAGCGWREGWIGTKFVRPRIEPPTGQFTLSALQEVSGDLRPEKSYLSREMLCEHEVAGGYRVLIPGSAARALGELAVFSTDHRMFDQSEATFLSSVAAVIAHSLQRKRSDEQRTILIGEMTHRAGNLLQLVSAVASQTLSQTPNATDLKVFNDRLAALSRSSRVIASEGWTETNFRKVAEETLLPFAGRLRVEGEAVLLTANLSFDLGLVLHELATNSCKYGSLSGSAGEVCLSWRIDEEMGKRLLSIDWWDIFDVSNADRPSNSDGFGSRLINALVVEKWDGSITLIKNSGYRLNLLLPLR